MANHPKRVFPALCFFLLARQLPVTGTFNNNLPWLGARIDQRVDQAAQLAKGNAKGRALDFALLFPVLDGQRPRDDSVFLLEHNMMPAIQVLYAPSLGIEIDEAPLLNAVLRQDTKRHEQRH